METQWVDDGLTNKVQRSRTAALAGEPKPLLEQNREDPIPEEYMDRLQQFIGDGLGGVSVSGDVGTSDFGNKAGVHVSVRVTCGNDEESLGGAHAIAREIAERFIREDLPYVEAILNEKLHPSKAAAASKALAASASRVPARAAAPAAPKQQVRPATKVNPPNFGR